MGKSLEQGSFCTLVSLTEFELAIVVSNAFGQVNVLIDQLPL
jgi:hypothetical protein